MNDLFERKILSQLKLMHVDFSLNEELKSHTTIKIGGRCKCYVYAKDIDELIKIVNICDNNYRYAILGAGSNLLVSSKGIDCVVIDTKLLNKILINDEYIVAESGVKLGALCNFALKHNYGGFEFMVGIPGSVGGAVVMNAGAMGQDTSKIVAKVEVLYNGRVQTLDNENILFNYRQNIFTNNKEYVILKVYFYKRYQDTEHIRQKIDEARSYRVKNQNVGYPSAGCVFNSVGLSPSFMIDKSGLKGLRVGGAEVSKIHAGFIVNVDNATSDDVVKLIAKIRNKIKQDWGKDLKLEIIYWRD